MKIKINKLDKLFSNLIRQRAGGKCEYCGKYTDRLETSHFISRRKRSTRWDIQNAAAVCFSCHIYLHENPHKHTEWFMQRLGTEEFEKLCIRGEKIAKFSQGDLDKIEYDLQDKISLLRESDL